MNEEKHKIIIIGEKNKLADKCVEWGDDFYIGDYDVAIIDTNTLTKELIKLILEKNEYYFSNLRDKIFEAQHSSKNIRIYCLLSNFFTVSETTHSNTDYDREGTFGMSNYAWSPVIPLIGKTKSLEIGNISTTTKFILDYLSKIKEFYPLEYYEKNVPKHLDGNGKFVAEAYQTTYVANKVEKPVIFSLGWKILQKRESGYSTSYHSDPIIKSIFPILFLPTLSNKNEGIEILLKSFISEDWKPEWLDKLLLPGESEIKTEIEEVEKEILLKKSEIAEKEIKLADLLAYKKLTYSSGKILEEITEKALKMLGIEVQSPKNKTVEDRFFVSDDGSQIPIEIRGRDSKGMSEEDLSQLIKRIADKPSSKNYKTRGIFVFNHFRKNEPETRGQAFHANIKKQAEAYNICLISSYDIYKLILKNLEGQDVSDTKDKLLNTSGEFIFKEDVEQAI